MSLNANIKKDYAKVNWFAEQMKNKLSKNSHKSGWTDCTLPELVKKLESEVDELKKAISTPRRGFSEEIILECADVANFAMMVADVSRTF